MIHKKFNIPIYFGELHVFIHEDFKLVNSKFKLGIDESYLVGNHDALTGRYQRKNGTVAKYFVILLPDASDKMIVHESCHVVNYVFYDTQVELDRLNDEPQCYLLGYVFGKIQGVKNINLK